MMKDDSSIKKIKAAFLVALLSLFLGISYLNEYLDNGVIESARGGPASGLDAKILVYGLNSIGLLALLYGLYVLIKMIMKNRNSMIAGPPVVTPEPLSIVQNPKLDNSIEASWQNRKGYVFQTIKTILIAAIIYLGFILLFKALSNH